MNEENKIVIVEDVDNIIKFDDITIKHDQVDRQEVADAEKEIAELETQKVGIDERIVALKVKIAYAKRVIEIADAKKLENQANDEQCDECSTEEVVVANTENEILGE